ncbi:unnamed protein product [Candida verbasci]|uniref:F-box domain-containing protein n=1 Tax=Candida verbasci TaxID=1227364 RepID=A0A9W4TUX2_9ASCO|nr:unnamed protein product [Candida verbasci]
MYDSLLQLPGEIIDLIISKQLKSVCNYYQDDLSNLSKSCKSLNQYINSNYLYKHIIIYDNDNSSIKKNKNKNKSNCVFIHINKLYIFANSLTIENFINIKSIQIYCKSNFNCYDYSHLYSKFNQFWKIVQHPIEFINFDVENIRKFQSINQYLLNMAHTDVLDENDETSDVTIYNNKLLNLKNWSILNIQELINLLPNDNDKLEILDFFIETYNNYIPANHYLNYENLKVLNLNTTISTKLFKNLSINIPKLQSLSLVYSHSFIELPLKFSDLENKIDFNSLKYLQLKLNCLHPNCNCINEFYEELSKNKQDFTKLQTLSIVNLNSKNSTNNIQQYQNLINFQFAGLIEKFTNLKKLFFNINEYSRIEGINLNQFFNNIKSIKFLDSLIVVDYFNWLPDNYRNGINGCKCGDCVKSRSLFTQLSNYDAGNNFNHNFKNFQYVDEQSSDIIILNKHNLKFISFLIGLYKKQFENQIIYPSLKEFHKINEFNELKSLLKHNFIDGKEGIDGVNVNLGGIEL